MDPSTILQEDVAGDVAQQQAAFELQTPSEEDRQAAARRIAEKYARMPAVIAHSRKVREEEAILRQQQQQQQAAELARRKAYERAELHT